MTRGAKEMMAPIAICNFCHKNYNASEWVELPHRAQASSGPGVMLEMRDCLCRPEGIRGTLGALRVEHTARYFTREELELIDNPPEQDLSARTYRDCFNDEQQLLQFEQDILAAYDGYPSSVFSYRRWLARHLPTPAPGETTGEAIERINKEVDDGDDIEDNQRS